MTTRVRDAASSASKSAGGDGARVTALAQGATSIVNAVNPPGYLTWETDCPPVAAAATPGRPRVTELRSSDYFGPGTTQRTRYLNDVLIVRARPHRGTRR